MIKVITYGTFDLLHEGHIRLLERAKKLGDYLIVGVTSDGFDINRGKINNHDSLYQRVEAVRSTGLADEIIVEEYEGQKIDDIRNNDVDIFTVGDDWVGKFDYLSEYCRVIYLPRTKGISSTQLRSDSRKNKMQLIGVSSLMDKYQKEASFVNGVVINDKENDSAFLFNEPQKRYVTIKKFLESGKHVLCNSPICLSVEQCEELFDLAGKKGLVLMEAIKTAYSVAFNRMVSLVKSGKIGEVVSIDATCTSLSDFNDGINKDFGALCLWGPIALLPIFQILGTDFIEHRIYSFLLDEGSLIDGFTKIDFLYSNAVASIKVAKAAKSEGDLIITGTKGYVYVPSPWWKTDYFEVRFEEIESTQKYFYQLEGEGIRNELTTFVKSIEAKKNFSRISKNITIAIVRTIENFLNKEFIKINLNQKK